MARPFSAKDAESLVNEHQDIEDKLVEAYNLVKNYYGFIETYSNDLVMKKIYDTMQKIPVGEMGFGANLTRMLYSQGLKNVFDIINKPIKIDDASIKIIKKDVERFAHQIRLDLKIKLSNDDKNTNTSRIVLSVYKYKYSLSYFEKLDNLIKKKDEIDNAIENLLPTITNIKWLFASQSDKQKALEAYNILSDFMMNDYKAEALNIISEINIIENTDSDTAWINFAENSKSYFEVMEQVEPGVFGTYDYLRPFTSDEANIIINKYNEIANIIEQTLSLSQSLYSDIKNSSNNLIAQGIYDTLKGIPIEELNREKNGISIKTLCEYGYNNMADIMGANVSNIASIPRISIDNAYFIKTIVNNLIEQIRPNTKIKISIDDKNENSTELVSSIYKYKCIFAYENTFESLIEKKREYDKLINKLLPAVRDITWFAMSKLAKKKALDAYNILIDLSNDIYFSNAQIIFNNYNNIKKITNEISWENYETDSISFINILEEINPGVLGSNEKVCDLPQELLNKIQEQEFFPEGLLCKLRKYQEWGVKYILHQEKVLLGDEMGLGKTVQAIASMVSLRNTGATHFAVVCPASVLINWCREIRKHSRLNVIKIHGNNRMNALNSWIKYGGVAVTTYETTQHFNISKSFKFSLAVVDEAQYIKNPCANRTYNVKRLCSHSERILFMTGTALENKVDEMIELIGALQPKIAIQAKEMASLYSAPQFRICIAPVYYRRKREDVLTELPELIESKEWCALQPMEEQVYEYAVLSKQFSKARRVSWDIENLQNSSKAKRLLEIVKEAEAENRKVVVFSFFLDTIKKITQLLGTKCLNPINGSVTPQKRQEIIDEFDNSSAGSVLLAQIQSGGTGLNIQSASVVVICEPQFKPSIENQAISRAYRMGQTRNVLVYRLLCENTVDERITQLLEEKQDLFNTYADESVAAKNSLEIDEKLFGNIIQAEIERINKKNGNKSI